MPKHRKLSVALIAEAEKWDGIRAGVAAIDKILDGPSYKAAAGVNWKDDHSEQTTPWLPNARSLLVLAMHHPEDDPRLDWFDRGNTAGNRRLTEISEALVAWLLRTHGVNAQALAYQVRAGRGLPEGCRRVCGIGCRRQKQPDTAPQMGTQGAASLGINRSSLVFQQTA